MRRRLAFAVVPLLAAALAAPVSRAATCVSRWSMYGHDPGRSMAQDCSDVSLTNAPTLHLKWVFNAGAPVTAQPAVVDGTVYVGAGDGTFYALPSDPPPGPVTPRWTFKVTDANQDSYGKFVSSAAVASVGDLAHVVAVGGGSTLYVLNGDTQNPNGEVLGSVCFDPRTDPAVRCKGSSEIMEIESSPVIVPVNDHEARIYVGMDYNEGGPGRAGIVRLTLEQEGGVWSLTPDWKFDVEGFTTYYAEDHPDDPSYIFTAGGPGQGCGNVWSSPMVSNGLVYFDTSNCDTSRYTDHSLYGAESVFALNAESGTVAWCYQPRHVNGDDLDFGASPNLLPTGNVGVGGKDGNYYSFPATKEPGATPLPGGEDACFGDHGQQPSWTTTVSTGGSVDGLIGTSAVGAVNGAGAVFAANAIPMPGQDNFMPDNQPQGLEQLTTLHAVNAATGEILWNGPNVLPTYAGPSYTNGVVFMPDTFGMNFSAYDANTGVPVWSFPMPAPASPAAIVGDSVYVGAGVSPGGDSPAPGLNTVLGSVGAVYAFQAVVPPVG